LWRSRSSDLARLLASEMVSVEGGPTAVLVGVEQEFRVIGPLGKIDFRHHIDALGLGERYMDPGDGYAYPRPSGAVVTCDERELEIVLPPTQAAPGFSTEIEMRQRDERDSIARLIDAETRQGHALEGESTHLSVSVPTDDVIAVARRYAEHFSATHMLLTGGGDAWGTWIRERPNRLELCSSPVDGPWLRALSSFAVGSVQAALEEGRSRGRGCALAVPRLQVKLERANGKPGWYVDRHAFGGDIYTEGRATKLRLADGGWITGAAHLEASWRVARDWLTGNGAANAADLEVMDAIVAGTMPLPCEPAFAAAAVDLARVDRASTPQAGLSASPFGSALQPRQRDGYGIGPVLMSWDLVVFVACGPDGGRRVFIPVSRPYLEVFLRQLDLGRVDALIRARLQRRPGRRTLRSLADINPPTIFDHLGGRGGLLTAEIAL
jgi:hypothetical protein